MMRKWDTVIIGDVKVEIWKDWQGHAFGRIPGVRLGRWQQQILAWMVYEGEVQPMPWLRGKAADFYTKYRHSLRSLVNKLKAAGLPVEYIPGPNGGAWSAKIVLKEVKP